MSATAVPQRGLLGNAIVLLRLALGDTQEEFAHRLSLSVGSIAHYETGYKPARRVLKRLIELATESGEVEFIDVFRQHLEPIPSLPVTMTTQQAIQELRKATRMTQLRFGKVLGFTKDTIIQYEHHVPPRGMALIPIAELADEFRRPGLAAVFRAALIREIDEASSTGRGFEGLVKQYLRSTGKR